MIFIDESRLQKLVPSLDEKSAAALKSAVPQAFGTAAAPEPVNVALEEMKATFPRLYEDLDAVEVPESPIVSFIAKLVSESRDPEVQNRAAKFILEAGAAPSPARKAADADPSGDPTKASSGPGRVRFEKTLIDGVEFELGYDHLGKCISTRLADAVSE